MCTVQSRLFAVYLLCNLFCLDTRCSCSSLSSQMHSSSATARCLLTLFIIINHWCVAGWLDVSSATKNVIYLRRHLLTGSASVLTAESSDWLIGSGKPGHTELSCQKDWRWLSRQRVVMLNFVWTNHVLEIVLVLLYFEWKLSKTQASLSNSMQVWMYWRFMQIMQRTFNGTTMQITHFILDKILKLLTYYTPFYR